MSDEPITEDDRPWLLIEHDDEMVASMTRVILAEYPSNEAKLITITKLLMARQDKREALTG